MNTRVDPATLLPTLADIEGAAEVVYREFPPTPQYRWGLLSERLGTDCWLKHENHTPVGAFKIRGGLTYFDQLAQRGALPREVISATRGNHGQSMGWAARRHGVACTIVVPRGNSVEKNAAMRALGVTLIEHGDDFQEAREHAIQLAAHRGAHMVLRGCERGFRGREGYCPRLTQGTRRRMCHLPMQGAQRRVSRGQ